MIINNIEYSRDDLYTTIMMSSNDNILKMLNKNTQTANDKLLLRLMILFEKYMYPHHGEYTRQAVSMYGGLEYMKENVDGFLNYLSEMSKHE